IRYLRHVAVDDCGKILNRRMVDGQIHGGIAQAAGQALLEQVLYDAEANPLTSNLTTYLVPTASNLPPVEIDHTVTPTTQNALGVKGIGEAGTIGATAAVQNAVIDALRPLGVDHLDMPLTPVRIWEALRDASP
ncbi:MAG: molybdopterin-dependent oxidoreductase, partial [bacterium]|nr:molybdopterin-dependent oxidoreductase [bacterium]